MKKIGIFLMCCVILFTGCKKSDDTQVNIPSKIKTTDSSSTSSPINSSTLDQYMFRDDVQYVDLRDSKMVLEEGYVAGFEFVPYYSIIASFSSGTALYQMRRVIDGDKVYVAGQIGGFVAQYEESESIINLLFSKDKYIFFISQGGSESAYIINLLVQLGYNGDLLYNVGGVTNSEGLPSYKSIKSNKYYIDGIGDYNLNITYGFLDELTPIN